MSKIVISFWFILLFSCAGAQKDITVIRDNVLASKYKETSEFLASSKMYNKENSKLLLLLEKGLILHYVGKYLESVNIFEEAKSLSDELYTISIKKKILTYALNDQSDNYYAEKMEQSQIRFYLALNYLLLYQNSGDKKYLVQSRATLLEWDSLMKNFKTQFAGRHVFKRDMSQKILGSLVHSLMDTELDRKIAIDLLKEAKELLLKNYNAYGTYNLEAPKFRQNFSKLHTLKLETVKKEYIKHTSFSKELTNYIDNQIKILSDKDELGVTFVFQKGIIAKKFVKKIEVPSGISGLTGNQDLHLKVPAMIKKPTKIRLQLVVKGNNVEKEIPLSIINPISLIAYESQLDRNKAIANKAAARVTLKHGVALAAAVGTYAAAASSGDDAVSAAIQAALLVFQLGSKLISLGEQADLRYWATLPNDIWISRISLPVGVYKLTVKYLKGETLLDSKDLGSLEVKSNHTVFNYKI